MTTPINKKPPESSTRLKKRLLLMIQKCSEKYNYQPVFDSDDGDYMICIDLISLIRKMYKKRKDGFEDEVLFFVNEMDDIFKKGTHYEQEFVTICFVEGIYDEVFEEEILSLFTPTLLEEYQKIIDFWKKGKIIE